MRKFVHKVYFTIILIAVSFGLFLLYQQSMHEEVIAQEIESNIQLQLEYMKYVVDDYFKDSVAAIESIESVIQNETDEAKILKFMEEELQQTPTYMSLYFGTPDNHMINGSGWIPPDTFDLRTRPWYIKATEENQLITTSIYLNASQDAWIVTYAKPVYNSSGEFLGVIGGDNTIESFVNVLKEQTISENGFAFFLDSDRSLIMHSQMRVLEADAANKENIMSQLDKKFQETMQGVSLTTIDNIEGYLAWNIIDETGWIIGNFAPLSDFVNQRLNQNLIIGTTIALAGIMLFFSFYIHRRWIVRPLLRLNDDINKILINENLAYRLPVYNHDPLLSIREVMNVTLGKTESLFDKMGENQRALESSERKNRAIVEVLPDLVFIFSPEGVFLDCLTKDPEKLYMKRELFIGKNVKEIMPDYISEKAITGISTTLKSGNIQSIEYSMVDQSEARYFEVRFIKISDEEVLALVRNITEDKKYLKRIENLSYRDQLTGMYNRRFYVEKLNQLDCENNLPLAIIMLDVNGLKLTNDAFGHLSGDELLISVAKVIEKYTITSDVIARVGGDEFIILLPKTTSDEVINFIDNVQVDIQEIYVANVPASVSMGWAMKEDSAESITDIFVKAENNMYQKKLTESQSMRHKVIQIILETLNAKNEREKIHSENVSKISKEIGKAMNMDYEMLKEIEIAGLMHDIGKIAVDDSILNKDGPLTETEYRIMKKHSENGYQILKSVDAYSSFAEYALSHHEKWNGSGYPMGLEGDEIPLISRIIAVADAYEAMTSNRPYRKAMKHEEAIIEIVKYSGIQFDPDIVEVFLKVFNNT